MTGFTPEEAHGRTPRLLRSGEHDAAFYQRLWQILISGNIFRDEFINRRKDGDLYWEHKSIMPLREGGGDIAHFVAIGRDVTGERRIEEEAQLRREQIIHTGRVNMIGEMAANITHEISQPLTAIINYSQGSIRRLQSGEIATDRLLGVFEHIVAQSQRAANSISTLRRLIARRQSARVSADINALIKEVVELAGRETRGGGIVIAFDLAPNLPSAYVDDVQIEQVILNLLRNGAEALASADGTHRELCVRTALTDDGNIEISVSDTGPGLPPRLAAKLFEPFFSTKPDGVGLGLAISRTIVETHGGRIWITPNPDRGVTFRFTVPAQTQTHER
jgi:PAS domain S-box-containing protein